MKSHEAKLLIMLLEQEHNTKKKLEDTEDGAVNSLGVDESKAKVLTENRRKKI